MRNTLYCLSSGFGLILAAALLLPLALGCDGAREDVGDATVTVKEPGDVILGEPAPTDTGTDSPATPGAAGAPAAP